MQYSERARVFVRAALVLRLRHRGEFVRYPEYVRTVARAAAVTPRARAQTGERTAPVCTRPALARSPPWTWPS